MAFLVFAGAVFMGACTLAAYAQNSESENVQTSFLGFDRNDYPGDENLALLHQRFAFTG